MHQPRNHVVRAGLWGAAPAALLLGAALAISPAVAAPSPTAATVSHGSLMPLNDSGVRGTVTLVERNGQIRANLDASGLEPGAMHMQHIHGFGDGSQATCPSMSLAGADGVLSFAEGLPAYGPVQVTLGHDTTSGGQLSYSRTFDTTDAGASVTSLGALRQYVVVVHGLTSGGSFVPSLPVACAVLTSHGS